MRVEKTLRYGNLLPLSHRDLQSTQRHVHSRASSSVEQDSSTASCKDQSEDWKLKERNMCREEHHTPASASIAFCAGSMIETLHAPKDTTLEETASPTFACGTCNHRKEAKEYWPTDLSNRFHQILSCR